MNEYQITELAKLIGQKWYLPLYELAKEAGVGKRWVTQAVRGGHIPPRVEMKLREVLEKL